MDIIITYDIKQNHTEIKSDLKSLGYKETIVAVTQGTNMKVSKSLPNTTLLKYGANEIQAVFDEVSSVINRHHGGLDRIFCAELAIGFQGICL